MFGVPGTHENMDILSNPLCMDPFQGSAYFFVPDPDSHIVSRKETLADSPSDPSPVEMRDGYAP